MHPSTDVRIPATSLDWIAHAPLQGCLAKILVKGKSGLFWLKEDISVNYLHTVDPTLGIFT